MTRAAPFLLLLAACSVFPLSEADCKPPSWRDAGYADGYFGAIPQDLRLIPECRDRHGVVVDRTEYLKGWADGHDEWDRIQGSVDVN